MTETQDIRHTAGPVEVFDRRRALRPYILAMTIDAQRYPAPVEGVTLMFGEPGDGLYWPAVGVGGISLAECRANARLLAAAYTSYDRHCGPRAVREAEADLLGAALDALHRIRRRTIGRREFDDDDLWIVRRMATDVLRRAGRLDDMTR